jgi:GTP-binding protein
LDLFNVYFENSYFSSDKLPDSDMPEIVFSGRSNVGKSSMINRLIGRKSLARVSSQPGKTASVNFYRAGGFRLVDLPGYGFARVSDAEKLRWSELVEGYFAMQRRIALVIQLVDIRRLVTPDDADMLNFLSHGGYEYIVAATKCDKLKSSELTAQAQALKGAALPECSGIVLFSSKTGQGCEELKSTILEYAQNI